MARKKKRKPETVLVEVSVQETLQRVISVTVEVGPDDDIEELARAQANKYDDSYWDVSSSDGYTFDYQKPDFDS